MGEPNLVARSIETALIMGGLLLALERYLRDLEAIKTIKRRLFIPSWKKSEREHEQDLPVSEG